MTPFQAAEVEGLLAVYADEGWAPWAIVRGDSLDVLDAAEALDEISRRAGWMAEEGPGHGANPTSGVRSLRQLMDRIQAAVDGAP